MATLLLVTTCHRAVEAGLFQKLWPNITLESLDTIETGIMGININADPGIVVTDIHTDRLTDCYNPLRMRAEG